MAGKERKPRARKTATARDTAPQTVGDSTAAQTDETMRASEQDTYDAMEAMEANSREDRAPNPRAQEARPSENRAPETRATIDDIDSSLQVRRTQDYGEVF